MENCNTPYVPSNSKNNKYVSSNHGSVTHPSIHSTRSRDFLETLFQKINSGDNVLSRIPRRLDPNIEFSDDEEDEPQNSLGKKTSPKYVENQISKYVDKENSKKVIPPTNPEDLQNKRRLFDDNIITQERKNIESNKYENMLSKCSLSCKINSNKEKKTVIHETSMKKESLNEFKETGHNSDILQSIINEKPHGLLTNKPSVEKTNHDLKNSKNEIIYPLPSDIIKVNNKIYNVLSLLGSGGSCKVYSVYDIENKSRVAIKKVYLKDADPIIQEGYMKEIDYLQKLQNSNRVIKMYDFEYLKNELLLVLEHGDIDFAKYISNEAKLKRLTPLRIKFYWSQMLEAVADIHKYGIVHSDLKPANFLLVTGNLKLIDFGIATSVPEDKTSTFRDTQVGTLNYMSPEAITQMSTDSAHPKFKVGVKSDVWSLGCILYNLVYGVTPFHNVKILMQKIYAITNPNYEIPFKPLSDILLLDVLKSCLKRNPKERASVQDLLQHQYLAEDNAPSAKSNPDLQNVLAQMQNLTPRRIQYVTKFVQELTEKVNK